MTGRAVLAGGIQGWRPSESLSWFSAHDAEGRTVATGRTYGEADRAARDAGHVPMTIRERHDDGEGDLWAPAPETHAPARPGPDSPSAARRAETRGDA